HLRAHCFIDLYEGKGARILERTRVARPRMKQSFQLRIRTPRLEFTYLEGRSLLEQAREGEISRRLWKQLREKILALNSENNLLASAYAATLEVGAAALRDESCAAVEFQRLAEIFSERRMKMHACA